MTRDLEAATETMMVHLQQTSARIYQFPVGGRAGRRDFATVNRPAFAEAVTPRNVEIHSSESWYHAEAITAAAKECKPA